MSSSPDCRLKRTRESTSKVRTGCSTCKSRRVKCDETKPVCRRCTAGKRKCEYSNPPQATSRRNVITVYLPPTSSQPTFYSNDRGLDFFYYNVAGKLDGQFDSGFWSRLIMQLSHNELPIRHAISALSMVYQDVESSIRDPARCVVANRATERQWSTAVSSLAARIQAYPDSILVPLVCCLLFTCIEFLRGNGEFSMLHVENGFKILATLRSTIGISALKGLKTLTSDDQTITDHIIPVFSRLNVLYSLTGRSTPPAYMSTTEGEQPLEDLTDARLQLHKISDTCIRFIGQAMHKAGLFQIDVDDLVEQIQLEARLNQWRYQVCQLVERTQGTGTPVNSDALNLLLVHFKTVYIWLRVCTTAGETAADSYHTDFQELLHYAEQVDKCETGATAPQLLSFEVHTLGPVYYTALKCRHPSTRRRALEMLRWAPRREGLWDAHYAYVTAKRVIELEEMGMDEQGLPDEACRVHGLPLPDNECRLHLSAEMYFGSQVGAESAVPDRPSRGMIEAEFLMRPQGLKRELQTVREYIEL